MDYTMDYDWPAVVAEFAQMNFICTPEQISNPEWCINKLAELGYAITVTAVTRAYARYLFKREPDYAAGVDMMYHYKLWGPRYAKRGHNSPLFPHLNSTVASALFNIVRLDWQDVNEAKLRPRH